MAENQYFLFLLFSLVYRVLFSVGVRLFADNFFMLTGKKYLLYINT